jgi:sigma-54-specific transcriptional regulator
MTVNDVPHRLPELLAQPVPSPAKAMLFHDPRSLALLPKIERVARSDATVVIVGETGSGKELVARHIHATSGRRGPFVAVNCGAFAEALVDAELFGHEAGAFTGAQGARAGWFEAANGGTLFLDEIGDLPGPMQVKLLRVLQERQVVRLGSRRPIAVDVRLVAATNVDLERAVEAQRFRADLYYRLNVAPLHLPPLRERPGDILPLAHHFIRQCSERMGRDEVRLAPDAEAALLAYAWPGNIRELENAIHFALIVSRGRPIGAGDLKLVPALLAPEVQDPSVEPQDDAASARPPAAQPEAQAGLSSAIDGIGGPPAPGAVPAGQPPIYQELAGFFDRLVERGDAALFQSVEEILVRSAYARCRENQVQTARALDITRNMLRTLLKRYGLLGASDTAAEEDGAVARVSRTPLRFPAGRPHSDAGHARPLAGSAAH